MKNFLKYSMLSFVVMSSVIGMQNNITSAQGSSNMCAVPYNNPRPLSYRSPLNSGITLDSGLRNRKERRAQGQRKRILTTEEIVQNMSDKIDQHIIGYEKSSCMSSVQRLFNVPGKIATIRRSFESEILQDLSVVDLYMQKAKQNGIRIDPDMIKLLADKNVIFRELVARLATLKSVEMDYALQRGDVIAIENLQCGGVNGFPLQLFELKVYLHLEILNKYRQLLVDRGELDPDDGIVTAC